MKKYLVLMALVLWVSIYIASYDRKSAEQGAQEAARLRGATPAAIANEQISQDDIEKAKRNEPGWFAFFRWPEGAGAIALIFTLLAIAEQTQATAKSAEAARQAIVLQHRPKVYVRSIRVYRPNPTEMEIRLTVRNGGSTIAHIQDSSFHIQWLKDGVPEPRPDDKVEAFDLQPGKAKTLRFSANEFAGVFGTEEIMHKANSRIRRDAVLLTCNGVIRYLDEIGTQRETGIARICDFATRQFFPVEDAEREYSD